MLAPSLWGWCQDAYFEGVVFDGLDDISEEHFGCEGVAMVDDGLPARPVPTVELHAATALHQGPGEETRLDQPPGTHLYSMSVSRGFTTGV